MLQHKKEIEEAVLLQKKTPEGFAVIEILEGNNIEMRVVKLPVTDWNEFGTFECIREINSEKIPSFRKLMEDE